jgi:PAS domain S-box-containing protein
LILGAADTGEFTVAEIGLARGVADQIGLALATGRLRETNARRTRELAALHSAALATGGALDADTALRSICDQAARAFDADAAGILLLNEERTVLRGAHIGGEGRTEAELERWRMVWFPVNAEIYMGELWRSGRSVAVADMHELPPEKTPGSRRLGFRSMLAAQLHVDGEPSGLLIVSDRRAGMFTSADVPLVEALAEHASTAIARARTYAVALAREEQTHFHAALLANVRDAVVATDLDGVITYWNRGAEDIFGQSAEQQTGLPLAELAPAREQRRLARLLRRVRRSGEERVEWPVARADGLRVWVDMRLSLLRDPRGEPVGHLVVVCTPDPRPEDRA